MSQDWFEYLTASHRFLGFDWSYLTALGFVGSFVFASRFVLQWIESERRRQSVIPRLFWHISIVGSLIMLLYFVLRRDPAGVIAYLPNSLIYIRNLQLIRRHEQTLGGMRNR